MPCEKKILRGVVQAGDLISKGLSEQSKPHTACCPGADSGLVNNVVIYIFAEGEEHMTKEELIKLKHKVEAEGFAPPNIWPEIVRLCELVAEQERETCTQICLEEAPTLDGQMKLEDLFTDDELALIDAGGYRPGRAVLDAKLDLWAALEREACAKVCDDAAELLNRLTNYVGADEANACAAAIRARGNK